mgnify:CR=1 FL=1
MSTYIISKDSPRNNDSVTIPRKKYEEFLEFEKIVEKRWAEESDTDEAIKIYKKEKQLGKLKTVKSLSDIGWYAHPSFIKIQEIRQA